MYDTLFSAIDVCSAGVTESRPATFSYDATEAKGRRKTPRIRSGSEDTILDQSKRSKITANARDIRRNFAIAGWMIRRHLDYVATFEFHARNKDEGLNNELEAMMRQFSRPDGCDVRGRHRLAKMIRLAEAGRCVDGDSGIEKLSSGYLNGIESDRIRTPTGLAESGDRQSWVNGVMTNRVGRALGYAVHSRRGMGGFEFEKLIPARNLCLHGFFDRFDQVRGVSPIVAGLNSLRDVHENFDYALAKSKVNQLFAMAFYREADESAGDTSNDSEDGEGKAGYQVDFGKGPVLLDLDPGDRAEFLESKNPSAEFQAFTQTVLTVALKSMDIPYSFLDESHTNFFGSRAAWLHYERSCRDKRDDVSELLRKITAWRVLLWILDGELELPRGMTLADLAWEWVPAGMPWWDPAKEITGDLKAIGAGLDNPQRIVRERGRGDYFDNIDQISRAMAYAKEKGVPLSFAIGAEPTQVEVVNSDN